MSSNVEYLNLTDSLNLGFNHQDAISAGYDGPGWYFWDETQAGCYGPYDTEDLAQKALERYCHTVLGVNPLTQAIGEVSEIIEKVCKELSAQAVDEFKSTQSMSVIMDLEDHDKLINDLTVLRRTVEGQTALVEGIKAEAAEYKRLFDTLFKLGLAKSDPGWTGQWVDEMISSITELKKTHDE